MYVSAQSHCLYTCLHNLYTIAVGRETCALTVQKLTVLEYENVNQ
jgi:hypothetical protein